MKTKLCNSMLMLRFGKVKVAKKSFDDIKNPIKRLDVNADDLVISKLIKKTINLCI